MCATTLKDLSVCNNWSNEELTFGAPVQASIFLSTLAVVHSHDFSNISSTHQVPLKKAIFAMPLIWIYYPNSQGACRVWKASFHWHLTMCRSMIIDPLHLILWYCAAAHDIRIVGWLAQLLCNNTDWANVNHACVSSTLNFELDQLYRTDSDFLEVINI